MGFKTTRRAHSMNGGGGRDDTIWDEVSHSKCIHVVESDPIASHNRTAINHVKVKEPEKQDARENTQSAEPADEEIRHVRRGDMIMYEELYSEDEDHMRWEHYSADLDNAEIMKIHHPIIDVRRTIQRTEIFGEAHKWFTTVCYHGDDALKLWEEDFRRLSQIDTLVIQILFGSMASILQASHHLSFAMDEVNRAIQPHTSSEGDPMRRKPEAPSPPLSKDPPPLKSEPRISDSFESPPKYPKTFRKREFARGFRAKPTRRNFEPVFGAEAATQTQDSRFEEIVEDPSPPREGADRNASVPWWKVASSMFDISAFPV
uniref:Uncharacterized protein n=1 Tax=Moniliophthora roreri TaxID=221103 RepID=A0A0W0G0W5_MONRR